MPTCTALDPKRPVREYGCCQCDRAGLPRYHREGLDPEYGPHLYWQSKHGWYERPPTLGEVFDRLMREEGT